MLSWIFKKRDAAPLPATASKASAKPSPSSTRKSAPATGSAAPAALPATAAEDWPARLQQAQGDDAALLHLASSAPRLETRLAAVQALVGEDSLRQAERSLRNRDRKLHSLAKSRLEAAVTQRSARSKAKQLLQHTEQLLQDPLLPVNHVVALDRDWQALPAAMLEPTQRDAFSSLRAALDSSIRERADAEQQQLRWTTQARRCLPDWTAAVAKVRARPLDVATVPAQPAEAPHPVLANVRSQASALRQARPELPGTEVLDAALAQLLALADDAQAQLDARPAPPAAAPNPVTAPAKPLPMPPRERHASADQRQQLDSALRLAEQALADGQLMALHQQLQAAETLQAAARGLQWPAALRARHQALRAEQQRLKSWQHWGGTRARDDLIQEAEALARLTLPLRVPQPSPDAAVAAPAPSEAPAPTASPAPLPPPKLHLRTHAEAIHGLRMRWKALDKLGNAGDNAQGALWQRFDAALTTAFQPVAAQHAAQQAARQQNLATRLALLDGLDAVLLPAGDAADPSDAASHWRDTARQLDAFQLAWRQLGPVEHTAPADARQPVLLRLQASTARLEAPLRDARARAAAEREQFIQRALALVPSPSGDSGRLPPGGELQRQLRSLQTEWQEHARALPLPRAIESALWTRFRAATDAVFAQRDAAFAAREAEQAAEVAEREALLDQLAALQPHTPVAQIERTLVEVDRAWQQAATQLPRAAGLALQARYREAHAAAASLAHAGLQQRWQSQIDGWAATLQSGLGDLPTAAVPAHHTRDTRADSGNTDTLLLQLEIALDLPATPEWQAARRQLKLRALKDTMEGRSAPTTGAAPAAQWLATLLQQPTLNAVQRQRLLLLLAALREAPPGTLGLAVPPA